MSLPDGLAASLGDELAASLGDELAAGLLLTTGALVAAGAGLVHAATAASRPTARSNRLIMGHLMESGPAPTRPLAGSRARARNLTRALVGQPEARRRYRCMSIAGRLQASGSVVLAPGAPVAWPVQQACWAAPIDVDARHGRNATLRPTAAPKGLRRRRREVERFLSRPSAMIEQSVAPQEPATTPLPRARPR
jgi:hypothetical protein